MESSSTSKVEMFKPVLLKAGIPLALSLAGFIFARIMAQRSTHCKQSSFKSKEVRSLKTNSEGSRGEDSFHSLSSTYLLCMEEDVSCLRRCLEDLQKRELELEMEFISYCNLKEKESALLELKHILLLEVARVEYMDKEVLFMEAESKRLEELVAEYVKVLEQLEEWKLDNELLERQVKKLLTKATMQSQRLCEQDLKLEARDAEVIRMHDELETRTKATKALEDEICKLRMILDQLQHETNGLLEKLELKEKSASSVSKNEAEVIKIEDYIRLSENLEQIQKDHAAEHEELIYLRWSNACLSHELKRHNAQQEDDTEQRNSNFEMHSEASIEIGNSWLEREVVAGMDSEHSVNEPRFGNVSSDHAVSKSRKLFRRLKRWVEGRDQKERGRVPLDEEAVKCFGRHSVSDESEEHHHTRRSCSSA